MCGAGVGVVVVVGGGVGGLGGEGQEDRGGGWGGVERERMGAVLILSNILVF